MNWHEVGAGAKQVLVLQGAPSNLDTFRPLIDELSADHRLLIPELPGYGASPALPPPYSLARVQELVEEGLAARGIDRVGIVGFSLGGYRALRMALSGRVKVSNLVLLGGYATFGAEEREGLKGMAGLLRSMRDFSDPAMRRLFLGRMLSPAFLLAHPDAAPGVEAWLDATTPAVLGDELEATAAIEDLTDRVASLTCPITAIVGERDLPCPPRYSEAIVRVAQRGELHVVADSGHAVLVEHEHEARRLIRAAIQRAD